jgi:hypothetical protein
MKTRLLFPALLVSFYLYQCALGAQNPVVWKGGMPGRPADWNCPRNWNTNRVPGVLDRVVIADVRTRGSFFPIVGTEVEPIAALLVEAGAELTIARGGRLLVETGDPSNDVVIVGQIHSNGHNFYNFRGIPLALADSIGIGMPK